MKPYSPGVPWEQSRVPSRNSKGECDSLYATQELPRDTHRNSRGSLSFLPQLEKSPMLPISFRDEGWFPCFDSRGIPTFPSHIRGGLSHLLKLERNPAVPAQVERILRSPSMIIQDKAWFPCTNSNGAPSTPDNTKGSLNPLLHL